MAIFIDNFTDNSNRWTIREDNHSSLKVGNGGYTIEIRDDSGGCVVWSNLPNHTQNDLGIQVKVQKILGSSDSIFGIVWGLISEENYNCLLLCFRDRFIIGYCLNGKMNFPIPYLPAPIRHEPGAINDISIFICKQIIEVNINGNQVLRKDWSNFITGDGIGFLSGPSSKMKILNLEVRTGSSVQVYQFSKFSPNPIIRFHVVSSNLKSVGYDISSHTLEIEFLNGAVYRYFDVPYEIYSGLLEAESHGSYFYRFIRNVFRYQQIQAKLFFQNTFENDEEDSDVDDSDEDEYGEDDSDEDDFDEYPDEEEIGPYHDAWGLWVDGEWVSYDD